MKWISDTLISLPAPPKQEPKVDLGGFVFTVGGISHSITLTDYEEFLTNLYAPPPQGNSNQVPPRN